jgi:sucrose-6-phosphate hydrolase SacC (GH32 family)
MKNRILFQLLIISFTISTFAKSKDVFLFTYFRDNGVAGVYLATSNDGYHFETANAGKPIMTPPKWKNQDLTRDPSIIYHKGLFRMVWTSHWTGKVFGYAESKDLLNWSEPIMVTPFSSVTDPLDLPDNVWAPEIHWDKFKKNYFIIYSSTTVRERSDRDSSDNSGRNASQYDNRMFITRTKDGKNFSQGKLFFDQGFSTIDGVMRLDEKNKRWAFVLKVSRNPDVAVHPGRNLCLSFTRLDLDNPQFTPVSAPIAGTYSPMFSNPDPYKSMAEGQCLLHYNNKWWLYWDEPAGNGMQMATSDDLKTWNFVKEKSFPEKAQHGTIIVVPQKVLKHLFSNK